MWIEIIQICTTESKSELLLGELTGLLSSIPEEDDELQVTLLRHATLPTDLSLHLMHYSDLTPQGKSDIGLQISSALGEFGLVSHSVWVHQYIISGASF